ncbi:hypothetical protein DSAG12_00606 [Promethearchaeum syntrophicum]|uniref:Uncharacterized protein n=1 Tax=Promethearchaeum syntrophicum TaxID=2594042 RepID=A0A5B9D6P1_9ARCH|nr:hypothetical protein [Candidatus Prometheoarchaeum syntrophicum]QEE14789.1 hypothetical protein DSAG12_00606 [Candidatus Prometheoarchaeum syntrophicum]
MSVNILTSHPNLFVADTQGYWYYYENAYESNLELYDIETHRILSGVFIVNAMLHYLMVGHLGSKYENGGNFFSVNSIFISEYGTNFVQGNSNHEYTP